LTRRRGGSLKSWGYEERQLAGDWIKFELATLDKPEVLQMAEILETSADDVVGKLLRVWGWFNLQSRDGYAGGVTGDALCKFIDRLVASQGFAATMKKVGWLSDRGLPNFDRHNGESAKNRVLSKERMKRLRDAGSVTNASPEKRREEKKETPIGIEVPDWVPKEEWSSFVEMRKKGGPFTDRAKTLALGELAKLRAAGHDPKALIDAAVLRGWKSFYPPKGAAVQDLGHYK
jgi:hypothetical protein